MNTKMSKKIIAILLCMVMVLGMAGCAGRAQEVSQEAEKPVSEEIQMAEAEEEYTDTPDRSSEGYTLIWSDEFDGDSLDTTKWSCQIGTGTSEGLTDWGNQELEYYTDREENVRVEDGELIITAINKGRRTCWWKDVYFSKNPYCDR